MKEIYASNRRATFDYEILDRYEAGISLRGHEVKAVKAGKINISGAFVNFTGGKPVLLNAEIQPYQPNNPSGVFEPTRTRSLLLNQKEINALLGAVTEKGLTIIPLSVYNKDHLIKVEIALARHLKKQDKRAAIKKREVGKEMKRYIR